MNELEEMKPIEGVIEQLADGIPVYCAHTEIVDIETVIPNPRNPNIHPEKQIEMLAKIIKHQGWRNPIVISDRSGLVVKGHGRLMAAQKLGVKQVPTDTQHYKNESAEYADLLADNKISELSENDNDLLKDLLQDIDTGEIDMSLTGFDEKELEGLMTQSFDEGSIREDDFDAAEEAEKIKEPITNHGDVWQLGNHRLICGSATVPSDISKLMNGDIADMVFTDPPYNVAYEGKTKDSLTIKNDSMNDEQFFQFLLDAYKVMITNTKEGGAIYVCHADSEGVNFRKAMKDAGWLLKQCLIWVKNTMVLGRQDYHWKHEPILYGWKPGDKHEWCSDRKQTTVIDDYAGITVQRLDNCSIISFSDGVQSATIKVPSFEVINATDDDLTSVWRFDKPVRNGEHPTMKPIALCARAITNSSRKGDTVIDLFGGSGSTLMACEQTGRKCRTSELDPVYCDVIVKRWETFTGKKAVLVK